MSYDIIAARDEIGIFNLIGTVAYATPPEQRSAAITKLLSKNGTELGYLHTQMSGYPLLDDAVICDALPDDFQFIVEDWGEETGNSELANDIVRQYEWAEAQEPPDETASDDGDLYYYESQGC